MLHTKPVMSNTAIVLKINTNTKINTLIVIVKLILRANSTLRPIFRLNIRLILRIRLRVRIRLNLKTKTNMNINIEVLLVLCLVFVVVSV